MSNKKDKKLFELEGGCCDALVLAYLPNQIIAKSHGRGFYIPSNNNIEGAFGDSLRKIFGQKEEATHWADAVRWPTISNLKRLEKRMLKGTREIICGDPEFQTIFEDYFSNIHEKFEHVWISGKGDLYRFEDGKRKESLQKFEEYWDQKEKERWIQIHKFMREYTRSEFKKNN